MSASAEKNATTASRELAWVAIALVAVVVSALSVVHASFENRRVFAELQDLRSHERQQQVEIGRLLIEESTWSSPAFIEKLAREKLAMVEPEKMQLGFGGSAVYKQYAALDLQELLSLRERSQ